MFRKVYFLCLTAEFRWLVPEESLVQYRSFANKVQDEWPEPESVGVVGGDLCPISQYNKWVRYFVQEPFLNGSTFEEHRQIEREHIRKLNQLTRGMH